MGHTAERVGWFEEMVSLSFASCFRQTVHSTSSFYEFITRHQFYQPGIGKRRVDSEKNTANCFGLFFFVFFAPGNSRRFFLFNTNTVH